MGGILLNASSDLFAQNQGFWRGHFVCFLQVGKYTLLVQRRIDTGSSITAFRFGFAQSGSVIGHSGWFFANKQTVVLWKYACNSDTALAICSYVINDPRSCDRLFSKR